MREFNESKILEKIPVKNSFPAESQGFDFLDIEIGAGTGMFARSYVNQNTDRYLISIEKTINKFNKFNNAIGGENISNLSAIHDNGISFVTQHLKEDSVDRFFFLYPNPYPKSKDKNKRFHAMPFMKKVISCLKKNGCIIFATNESFLKQECIEYMTKTWNLKLDEFQEVVKSEDFVPWTLFEKKYVERGETCYRMSFSHSREKTTKMLADILSRP